MTTTIYLLRDPRDNRPRYVGKANDLAARCAEHLWHRGRNQPRLQAWIATLRSKGLLPLVQVLRVFSNEQAAFLAERRFIAEYRQHYDLANLTDGGEGVSGWHHHSESVRSISEKQRGRVVPAERREQIAATLRGRKNPHEGHKWSEEQKAKYLASMKELRDSGAPKLKEQFRNMLANRDTPEYRKKLSDAMKRRWERREPALLVETEAKAEQRRKRVLARWSKP